MDVNELDECRLWDEAQQGRDAVSGFEGDGVEAQGEGDEMMGDEGFEEDQEEEVEYGEDMDAVQEVVDEGEMAQAREADSQRRKGSRRPGVREGLVNGSSPGGGGGTAVRVGDGG